MKEYNGIVNVSEPENDYSLYIMYSFDKSDNLKEKEKFLHINHYIFG